MTLKFKIRFIIINAICFIAFSYVLNKIFNHYFSEESLINGNTQGLNLFVTILLAVIIGPLLETLIFQTAIIESAYFMLKKHRRVWVYSCSISAVLFGCTHLYSIPYFIYGILVGVYLSILYVIAKSKGINSTLLVIMVHASWNAIAVMLNYFN